MLLTENSQLEERIVEVLARHPSAEAELLHQEVTTRWKAYTLQAIYKELRKLEQGGVIVRRKGRYSLRYLWLIELSEFARKGYESFRSSDALLNDLPAEGEKQRWVLYDLKRLLDLWTDLFFHLVRTLPEKQRILCEYVEHVWFHTANPINERHFIRAMRREAVKFVLVSSRDTYLDKGYLPILKELQAEYSFGPRGFPAPENRYYSVFGDFIIEVRLAAPMNKKIQKLYADVRSAKDLSAQKILEFSNSRARCRLELRRNAKEAQRERAKFERFFGKKFLPWFSDSQGVL